MPDESKDGLGAESGEQKEQPVEWLFEASEALLVEGVTDNKKEEFLGRAERSAPKMRLKRIDREQSFFRAIAVEDLIEAEHPARAIWEMTGLLDLGGYYARVRAVEGVAGRERTDPRLLLALWVYALTQSVSSAREIERMCEYHPAFQWLCGMKGVNHHTLSDFRVENKEALDGLFVEQLGLLSKEGFIDLTRVMHDGTKVQAQAGGNSFKREKTLEAHLEEARKLVEKLSDPEHGEEESKKQRSARERAARESVERLLLAHSEMVKVRAIKQTEEEKKEARVSETDPEARVMKQSNGGFLPSYNVQISTDSAATVIIAAEPTQSGNDANELTPAVDRVEENFGKKPEQMVVDGGYTTRGNIASMAELGVEMIGSLADRTNSIVAGYTRRGITKEFWSEAFKYEEAGNRLICPNDEVLKYDRKKKIDGAVEYSYRAAGAVCAACPFKSQCCPKSQKGSGRIVVRTVESQTATDFRLKMETEEAKSIYKQRSEVAEFPNLWLKEKLGLRKFRLRGLMKVGMETILACLTYNIQAWIRLSWLPKLKNAAAVG